MLTLPRLKQIHLKTTPIGQVMVANLVLAFDYRFPKETDIQLEGIENLPQDRSVFIAMNHTDKYNYWPFQFRMHKMGLRYTATWVKGKYYTHPITALFLDKMNNIPMPSRGYLIVTRFRELMGRKPEGEEYRTLRDLGEGKTTSEEARAHDVVRAYLDLEETDDYASLLEGRFLAYVKEVIRIHREAQASQAIHFLVFPQGTRSVQLLPGHTGMMHMAQHLGLDIVPVGCSGSDLLYPSDNPFSRGGKVTYRVGEPLSLDGPEMSPYRIREDFIPFSRDANERFQERFEAGTGVVMDHINGLLEPRYQYGTDGDAVTDASDNVRRFL